MLIHLYRVRKVSRLLEKRIAQTELRVWRFAPLERGYSNGVTFYSFQP
jgi:hypothetical protein